MRRIALAWLAALGCACGNSGGSGGPPPATPSPTPTRAPNEFGAFNFTIETLPVAAQTDLLTSYGYRGVMIPYEAGTLNAFLAQPAVADGRFRVISVLFGIDANRGVDRASLTAAIDDAVRAKALASMEVSWSTNRPVDHASVVRAVQEAANIAAAADGGQGTTLAIYPHAGLLIDDAEAALALLREANRPNLRLSLHLCHEMIAGNQNRLGEVIAAVAPYIALATINGADVGREALAESVWAPYIKPLARGTLDVEHLYLKALLDSGYTGPVILHTYALREPPTVHYPESMTRWRQMMQAYGLPPS